jgi:hypothetical protein
VGAMRNFNSLSEWNQRLDIKQIVLVRNPIDMIVSAYYSFGWTHGAGDSKIRNMTIEEFAESSYPGSKRFYKEAFADLVTTATVHDPESLYVSYDELVLSYRTFLNKVAKFLELRFEEEKANMIYELTCCTAKGQVNILRQARLQDRESKSHHRSVIPGRGSLHFTPMYYRHLLDFFSRELTSLKSLNTFQIDTSRVFDPIAKWD